FWIDHDGTSVSVSPWFSVVPDESESSIPRLLDAQQRTDTAWSERIARALAHTPRGDLVIRNARLFDPRDLGVTPATSVVVSGERIVRVGPDAEHGYAQIKIYSSIKPELVPIIADHAHARGLRVSGHVPAFMSARQFIEGGADEIQHLNFIVLNFLFPEVKETRNRDRFIKVAEHARDFTPESA